MKAVVVDLSVYDVAAWTDTLHLCDRRSGKLVCSRELPDEARVASFNAEQGNVGKVCRNCLRMALCGEMDALAVTRWREHG
jgi:hypothetical protein